MPKWEGCPVLESVSFAIKQQQLQREKEKKTLELIKSQPRQRDKKRNHSPIDGGEASRRDKIKKLKQLEKDEERIDSTRKMVREACVRRENEKKEIETNKEDESAEEDSGDGNDDDDGEDDVNDNTEGEEEEEEDEDKIEGKKKCSQKIKTKKKLEFRDRDSENAVKLEQDLGVQIENIKKAKTILSGQIKRQKKITADKNQSKMASGVELKRYLSSVKIKK